jgi:hypothetical protein
MRERNGVIMRPLRERFEEKYVPEPNSGCWLWTAALRNGYGVIGIGRKGSGVARAHRLAYEWYRGPIPPGLVLDHLCRTPSCVNPDHLEAVTDQVNLRRGMAPNMVARRTDTCTRGHVGTLVLIGTSQRRRCSVCVKASKTEWRLKNREKINAHNRAKYAVRRAEAR